MGNNSVTELQFLHDTLSLMTISQCIKFLSIRFYTFRDMLWTNALLQKLRWENSVITCNRVTVPTLCTSSDGLLSIYQVS